MIKQNVLFTLLILFIFQSVSALDKNTETYNPKIFGEESSPILIHRYENPTSMFKVVEDLQILRPPSMKEYASGLIAIRVCSEKQLLLSIPSTTINPMQIADFLTTTGGYKPSNLLILSSKDCMSSAKDEIFPVEIWSLQNTSDIPKNTEHYNYTQIKYLSLGFDPVECSKNYSEKAAKVLIRKMLNDKNSFAVVISYYLNKPDSNLIRRVKAIETLLKKSGISNSRYTITKQSWHDGDSACSGKEPTQPMIIFTTLN